MSGKVNGILALLSPAESDPLYEASVIAAVLPGADAVGICNEDEEGVYQGIHEV